MKKILKNTGVESKPTKFDYFEFARNNKELGKSITHAEAMKLIEQARIEKLKKAF
jgi:hypothetical protein